jgi:hypothetical protein
MKRALGIAVVCLLLVAAAGTSTAIARQPDGTPQAGASPVYLFDVSAGGSVVGKLVVNTAAQTFVLNARGLEPGTTLYLRYVTAASPRTLALIVPDKAGTVHRSGRWPSFLDVRAVGGFTVVTDTGPLVAVLEGASWPTTCTPYNVMPVSCDVSALARDSTGPIVLYRLDYTQVWADGSMGGSTVYRGTDPYLGEPRIRATYGPGYAFSWDLAVWDAAGNKAWATLNWTYPNEDWQ